MTSKALEASKYVMYCGWPLSFGSASTYVTSRAAMLEDDESVKPHCCEDCVGAKVSLRGSISILSSIFPTMDVTVIRW